MESAVPEPAEVTTVDRTLPHRPQAAFSLLSLVGGTPLLELARLGRELAPVRLFAKAEWFNPGGSVKDRAALNMILQGEHSGRLSRRQTILDATSGNTGIAYAMLGTTLGYRVKLVLPGNLGPTHRRILTAYGAELVLSSPQEGSDGAIRLARKLYAESPRAYFYPDQYENPANWQAHYHGTGLEIWQQTRGRVTHWVAGLGTSGTFMGTAKRLKALDPAIQCLAVQPDSPLHGLEGLKHMPTSLVPGIYDPTLPDQILEVGTEEAQAAVRRAAREEGLLLGLSAGAALAASLRVARGLSAGVVVTVFPDGAFKYFEQSFWQEGPA